MPNARPRGRTSVRGRAGPRKPADTRRRTTVRRARKAPVKAIAANTRAVARLSDAVNGHVQKNLQLCRFTTPLYSLLPLKPVCFQANDFYSFPDGPIYGAEYTGAVGSLVPNELIIGNWQKNNPGAAQGLDTPYRQWPHMNLSAVSSKCYQPLGAKYTLTFVRDQQTDSTQDTFIRVDVVKPRKNFMQTTAHNYVLPKNLGALSRMAMSSASGERNSYNPALWSVKSKYVCLKAMDVTRRFNSATVTLNMSFPRKLLKPMYDPNNAGPTPPLWAQIPLDEQQWVVINVSNEQASATTSGIKMQFARSITWRDQSQTAI